MKEFHLVEDKGSRRFETVRSACPTSPHLAFVFVVVGKLAGTQMVELFDKVGLGQWFRYLTGLLEVAGGIGLVIPRYAFYAAILLVIVMIGAVITHLAIIGGSPAPAASLLALSGIIAWLRKP